MSPPNVARTKTKQPQTSPTYKTTTEGSLMLGSDPSLYKQSITVMGNEHSTAIVHNTEGVRASSNPVSSIATVCTDESLLNVGQRPSNPSLVSPPPVSRIVSSESHKLAQQEDSAINSSSAEYGKPRVRNYNPVALVGECASAKSSATLGNKQADTDTAINLSSGGKQAVGTKRGITKYVTEEIVESQAVAVKSKQPLALRSPLKKVKTTHPEIGASNATAAPGTISAPIPSVQNVMDKKVLLRVKPVLPGLTDTVTSSPTMTTTAPNQASCPSEPTHRPALPQTSTPMQVVHASPAHKPQTPGMAPQSTQNVQIRVKAPGGMANQAIIHQVQQMITSGQLGKFGPGCKVRIRMPTSTTPIKPTPGSPGVGVGPVLTTPHVKHIPVAAPSSLVSRPMASTIGKFGAFQTKQETYQPMPKALSEQHEGSKDGDTVKQMDRTYAKTNTDDSIVLPSDVVETVKSKNVTPSDKPGQKPTTVPNTSSSTLSPKESQLVTEGQLDTEKINDIPLAPPAPHLGDTAGNNRDKMEKETTQRPSRKVPVSKKIMGVPPPPTG